MGAGEGQFGQPGAPPTYQPLPLPHHCFPKELSFM